MLFMQHWGKVYNTHGFGFLESVYQKAMAVELTKLGLSFEVEKPLKVHYEDQIIGEFYIDLFVENEIVVELKSVKAIAKEHEVQLVNYFEWHETRFWAPNQFWPHRYRGKKKTQAAKQTGLTRCKELCA